MKKKLYDKNMSFSNYIKFKPARLINGGKEVKFVYANNESYTVPVEKIKKWFLQPHYCYRNGRWIEYQKNRHKVSANARLVGARRVKIYTAIRLYFSDKTACDVAWDTVLMACEPAYEHYGGLKKKA